MFAVTRPRLNRSGGRRPDRPRQTGLSREPIPRMTPHVRFFPSERRKFESFRLHVDHGGSIDAQDQLRTPNRPLEHLQTLRSLAVDGPLLWQALQNALPRLVGLDEKLVGLDHLFKPKQPRDPHLRGDL